MRFGVVEPSDAPEVTRPVASLHPSEVPKEIDNPKGFAVMRVWQNFRRVDVDFAASTKLQELRPSLALVAEY
jgi:hypothetical protein